MSTKVSVLISLRKKSTSFAITDLPINGQDASQRVISPVATYALRIPSIVCTETVVFPWSQVLALIKCCGQSVLQLIPATSAICSCVGVLTQSSMSLAIS